ncbi:hypothetical protein AVEN_164803-1 [Araneus ventricosus]|uniref:Uncharacterized protein n=1 Tax=Araneus ventricosus TaxID=182803 RepID=A0A4Y2WIE9_ARAVE|nr:hypothetical protein AVEN_164803-1 [Araneus ventricosus]
MVWWHSTPFHFSANPFRQVIHGPLRARLKFMSCGSSEPLIQLFLSLPSKRDIPLSSRAKESQPLPHVPSPVAFQHLWPGNPNEVLGIQDNWISNLSTAPFQSSSDFRIDDGFWCGAERF